MNSKLNIHIADDSHFEYVNPDFGGWGRISWHRILTLITFFVFKQTPFSKICDFFFLKISTISVALDLVVNGT